jgi:hypothetical protein
MRRRCSRGGWLMGTKARPTQLWIHSEVQCWQAGRRAAQQPGGRLKPGRMRGRYPGPG